MASHRQLLNPGGAGWWGLENEGTDYEAGALMAQDFIFWRLFFKSSSSNLPKFSDAPGPRARGPERGWEKGAGIPFLDLQALYCPLILSPATAGAGWCSCRPRLPSVALTSPGSH